MPEVTTESIKALRELTGAGIMDCKQALEEAAGDVERAQELLRQKGLASVGKRAAREANEGLIETYVHSGGRIGALVELNCETDFVARTDEFRGLAHDLAMQVAAMSPQYVSTDEMPQADGLNPEELCLLNQPFIKDPARAIQELLNDVAVKTGEKIRVRRFARFSLGQE